MECNKEDVTLSFVAEWFDPNSQMLKQFLLTYHVNSFEVEMNDFKRRKFLKKIKIPPTLTSSDFIKGSTIVLLSRELKLVEYADTATRHLLVGKEERTTVLVTPSLFDSIGDVTSSIENEGYTLVDIKSLHFSSSIDDINEAMQLLSGMELHDLCSSTSTPFVAMSFRGSDSIASVRKLVQSSPFRHGLVCPRVGEEKEFSNFFLHKDRSTATLEGCTCCVVRPHIIKDRTFGRGKFNVWVNNFHGCNILGFADIYCSRE
jgi:nucleoside-diphosphate kinase